LTTAWPAAFTAELKLSFFGEGSLLANNVKGRPLPWRKSGTSNKMTEEMTKPMRIDFSKKEKVFSTSNIKCFLRQVS
jgi:hypothetical protein